MPRKSIVNFAYENSSENVLEKLCLRIKAGQQIGIIGKSGSGKSTILGLMLGLLQPTSGNVLINGKHCKDFFSKWKLQFAHPNGH